MNQHESDDRPRRLGAFATYREHLPPPPIGPLTLDDFDDFDDDAMSTGSVELNSLSSDNSQGWMGDLIEFDLWSVPYVEPVSFDELFAFTDSMLQQNDEEDELPVLYKDSVDIIDLTVDEEEETNYPN